MFKAIIAAIFIVAGLAGCNRVQQVYDVSNRPLLMAEKAASLDDVRDAIIAAAGDADWTVLENGNGYLIAEQRWRTHAAVVRIDYTREDFSIRYHDSENLLVGRYEEGVIHRQYNLRVRELERKIATALQRRSG